MELAQVLMAIRRWWWLLVVSTALAAAISFAASMRSPRVYSATTTLMVGQLLRSANPQAGDFQTSEQLAQSYAQLVRREPVLSATIEALSLSIPLQALAGQVNATALANTPLIQISALANDPETAVRIANEVGRQLIRQSPTPQDREQEQRRQFVTQQLQGLQAKITDAQSQIDAYQDRLSRETSARSVQDLQNQIAVLRQQVVNWQSTYANLLANEGQATNNLSIVDAAVASSAPISPNVPLNVLVAASIGFALALAATLLLEYFDDRITSTDLAERALGVPTFGVIRRQNKAERLSGGILTARDFWSPTAESYRQLRANLQVATMGDLTSAILIASAVPGEGKSTISANLAVMIAHGGKRVLLCDADLRMPTVHSLFGIGNRIGLSDLLLNEALRLGDCLANGPVDGLKILTSGTLPQHPAELLNSRNLRMRIAEMEEYADVVIFDTPALLAVTDAMPLASLCSGAILVVDSAKTSSRQARRVKGILDQIDLPVLGVVLNNCNEKRVPYGHYYGAAAAASEGAHMSVSRTDVWPSLAVSRLARPVTRPPA
jgi:capsular exopolysaccharide synthesis family protein